MDEISGKNKLLVVDDKENTRTLLFDVFTERGFLVTTAANGDEAVERIAGDHFDLIITDMNMPGRNGLDVLRCAKSASPDTAVIIITAYGTIDTAVEAMRLGAADFIAKPFKLAEIEHKVQKCLREHVQLHGVPPFTEFDVGERRIVGESEHTKRLLSLIKKIGPTRSSVLITGPSGTGKELVARAVHDASPRRNGPFVAINCAALAPGILESELFGHEKGAFTGAVRQRIGCFERAHKGTLFLDEVGEIDVGIQVKLLRVLEGGEFERVGGMETVHVDVRLVAATNRDLREAIAQKTFREDFFYRLNVFSVKLEPLCARRDDIPALVDYFLAQFSAELGKQVVEVDDAVLEIFLEYAWPGNIRELENVLERAVVLAEGPCITRGELPPELVEFQPVITKPEPKQTQSAENRSVSLVEHTDRVERELIAQALERFRWNKSKTAEHLGLKRTTLQYKIRKYGLE